MTLSGRFFLPGPVEIDAVVAQAMLRPMMGHRGVEAGNLVASCQPGLRACFGTERPVMMITGSATAMMEAAVKAAVRERALCIVSGIFGERMAYTIEHNGKEVVRLHVHRGDVLLPDLLDTMLDGPPFDTVTMVHSETSTGALAPVELLLERLRKVEDVITIVDCVSSLAGIPVEADRWGADFVLTGSQKAIGIPPGLAFGVASQRFLDRAQTIEDRGFYLDAIDLFDAASESRFPQTPALPVVYALEKQMERIMKEGLEARFARHRVMRSKMETWVDSHKRCRIFAPPGYRADTVTALVVDEGKSARTIAHTLAGQGWQVALGIDEDEDRVIRIGHMGDLMPEQLDPLFAVLEPLL
ncbi:MAG: pyridoxal-phosphate-dependent aminotransferase family protein [Gemmatimonadales bacterium]